MDFLQPIADREPLVWIVQEQRTAFSAARRREAEMVAVGDRLFLYSTRGCFHSPTKDRGRVMGLASVKSEATRLEPPAHFGSREYPFGIDLEIKVLSACRTGVELAPLVTRLRTFPNPRAWSAWLRRAILPLADGDGDVLAALLAEVAAPYPEAVGTYGREPAAAV